MLLADHGITSFVSITRQNIKNLLATIGEHRLPIRLKFLILLALVVVSHDHLLAGGGRGSGVSSH